MNPAPAVECLTAFQTAFPPAPPKPKHQSEQEGNPAMKTTPIPVADDFTTQYDAEHSFPFIEDENANITGYDHQDKAAFADAVNRYDEVCNGEPFPEEEQWRAEHVQRDPDHDPVGAAMTSPIDALSPPPRYHRHFPDGPVFPNDPDCVACTVVEPEPVIVIAANDLPAIRALMRAYDAHGGCGLRAMRQAIDDLTNPTQEGTPS